MGTALNNNHLNAVIGGFGHLSGAGLWSPLYSAADGFTYHSHARRRLNPPFERWRRAMSPSPSFFAHGYAVRYRKTGR
jgi:hypothetical protein